RSRCWRDCGRVLQYGSLDYNSGGRPCLEEADRRIPKCRKSICVKTEVIQCAEADRVRVLILRKRFAVPGYGSTRLSDSPGRAAVTLVIRRAVVCPARFLRRRVKSDVTEIGHKTHRQAKGLNAAIEIFVIDGVFIVPYAVIWPRHLRADKENPVASRDRLHLIYRRPWPSHDGRLHSPGHANRRKGEVRCTANKELTVRSIVIHIALPGMGLTPRVLLRRQVCRFREIGCALIKRRV